MPFDVQGAQAAGYSPQEIQSYLASKAQSQPQAPAPVPSHGGGIWPILGGIVGGVGGGLLGGIPGAVIGGGLLSGVGSALSGGNAGDITRETVMGGLGGLFPEFKGAKLLGIGAKAAEEAGAQTAERAAVKGGESLLGKGAERLAMASNKINPSQFVALKETLGQNPGRFLLSGEGGQLLGKNPEQLTKIIQPIQESFTQLAEHQGVKVHPADIYQTLSDQYNQLANTTGAAAATKAKNLEQGILSFVNKYGGPEYATGIPMKEINNEAINVGKLVKDFDTAGTERSADRILRDAYRGGMQQATENAGLAGPGGETLKELGQRLNKLYELQGVVTKQEGLGQGTGIAGLTGLLGAGVGGPAGGIGGAALGFGAVKASQNPKVLAFLARNADRLAQSNIPQLAGKVGAQTLGQTGARVLGGLVQPQEAQAAEPTASELALASNAGGNVGMGGGATRQNPLNAIFAAAILKNPKQAAALMAAHKLLSAGQDLGPSVGKVSAKDYALARSGLKNVQEVRQFFKEDPTVLTKQLVPGQYLSRKFDSAVYDTFDALLRLRTGAQANPTEIRGYMKKLGPTFGDSPQVVKYKLDKLESDLKFYQQGGSADNSLPLPATGLGE